MWRRLKELFKFAVSKKNEASSNLMLRELVSVKNNYTNKELKLIASELESFYKRKFRERERETHQRYLLFSTSRRTI